jgi:hypothetical protein
MHQVDYQLGLSASSEDEYLNGDGSAIALRHACGLKCNISHPFNKSRRLACKDKCDSKFAVRLDTGKTFGINQIMSAQEEEAAYAAEEEAVLMEMQAAQAALVQSQSKAPSGGSDRGSDEKKAGLGTGAMIGIGVGVIVLVVGVVLITRKK